MRVEVSTNFLFLEVTKRNGRADELGMLNRSVGDEKGNSIGLSSRGIESSVCEGKS